MSLARHSKVSLEPVRKTYRTLNVVEDSILPLNSYGVSSSPNTSFVSTLESSSNSKVNKKGKKTKSLPFVFILFTLSYFRAKLETG